MGRKKAEQAQAYKTGAELKAACDRYFTAVDQRGEMPNEHGLALSLGVRLSELQKWRNGDEAPHLQEAVEYAYTRIADGIVRFVTRPEASRSANQFGKFMMQNLAGYSDREQSNQRMEVSVKMGANMDSGDFA